MTRAEKVAEARRCDGCGVTLPEQGGPGRRRRWCSERCRRTTLYAGVCVDCGAATNGNNGLGKAPKRCAGCRDRHQHETRHWTPEAIVEAIRAFADRYGRPPMASDWHMHAEASDERRERFYRDGCWPPYNTARREFGSWNAALSAAGFEPTREFKMPFRDDPTLLDDVAAEYLSGDSPVEIAARYGVSASRVAQICGQLGIRRTLSEAGQLRARRKRERVAA